MKIRHLKLIAFVLIIGINHAEAQERKGSETINESQDSIRYVPGISSNSNQIITRLSESYSGKPEDVFIKFTFKEVITTEPSSSGTEISFQLLNLKIKEEIIYKGFSVNTLLLPTKVMFSARIMSNNKKLAEFETKEAKIQRNNTRKVVHSYEGFEDFNAGDVQVKSIYFDYSNLAKQRFEERVKTIDEYYNIASMMDLEEKKVGEMDLQNIDLLPTYRERIQETKKFIKDIENKNLKAKLNLTNTDPINFVNKLKNFKEKINGLEGSIDHALANMHETHYKKGLQLLEKKDITGAKNSFNKSIEIKSDYAPPYIKMAGFLQSEGKNDTTIYLILKVIKGMNPSMEMKDEYIRIAGRVVNDFEEKAIVLNESEDYSEALGYLQKISAICSKISKSLCSESVYNEFTKSHTGVYSGLLKNIESFIQQKAYKQAEILIDSAVTYKNENNYYIEVQDRLIPLINTLFSAVMQNGNAQLKSEAFNGASVSFLMAESLCKKFVPIRCTDAIYSGLKKAYQGIYEKSIDSVRNYYEARQYREAEKLIDKLKQYQIKYELKESQALLNLEKLVFEKYYAQVIEEAKKQIQLKKYMDALELLDRARQWQNYYEFSKYEGFEALYQDASEQAIIAEIKLGKRRAAENKIAQARKHYSMANAMLEIYKITMTQEINAQFEELKAAIFSQKCFNAQLDYDVQLNTATRFIEEGKYIEADNALMKAVRISDENSECQILTKDAILKRDSIWKIVHFQQQLIEINEELEKESYLNALNKYIELEQFYQDSNIREASGLELATLDEFIMSGKEGFINFAVKHYASVNKLDLAMKYLRQLNAKDYKAKWTESNQILLGTHLAIQDHKKYPDKDPRDLVTAYTGNEKWFKVLKKTYVKKFKELSR